MVAPPVVMQPQLFSADMLDPQSRSIHNQLATKHMSSTALLDTVQQAGNRLQSAVHGQFASLRVSRGIHRDNALLLFINFNIVLPCALIQLRLVGMIFTVYI